jgi:hypothetical protein
VLNSNNILIYGIPLLVTSYTSKYRTRDTRQSLRHKTRRHLRPRDYPELVDTIPVAIQGSTVRYNKVLIIFFL